MSTDSPPTSVQLYSVRDEAAKDFEGVLRRLGDIGFVGVELAGFHDLTPKQYAAIVEESGLETSSAHLPDLSPDALGAALDDLQEIGCDVAVCAFLPPERFADLDSIERSADALNKANDLARSRGVSLGYHNHWWEFSTNVDGQTAWSALMERLDTTVFVELDIYWTTLGGADPRQVIADLGDRLWLLHVKDGPCDAPESPMVAVGSGTLDIPAILTSAPTAKWHIVELDRCATDMFTALADSYRYLVDSGLSQGRK
jgi:sugar phosphate isomerase/epimerase